MTLLTLTLFLGMVVAIIGVLLCGVHIVELERRLAILERERAERIVDKLTTVYPPTTTLRGASAVQHGRIPVPMSVEGLERNR